MMEAIQEGIAEAHGIMGKFNPADMFTKPQDGPSTTKWRRDLLGIELVNKVQGVKLPPTLKWKPFIANYSTIIDSFVIEYDNYFSGLLGKESW